MPRIVLITTSFPEEKYNREFAGSFAADIASELAKHVNVDVITPSLHDSVVEHGNLCIRYFSVPSLPLSLLKPYNPRHWLAIIKTLKAGQKAIDQAVYQHKPDHILALWVLPSGYWARTVGRKTGVEYSTWALGSDIWTLGKIPPTRIMLRKVLRKSKNRFADGYQLARDVEGICGMSCSFLPSARHYPLVTNEQLKKTPPYNLAFLGRWHPNKGIDLLLDALARLTTTEWELINEFRVFGGGPLQPLVHKQVKKLAEAGHPVSLGGYLNKEESAALLHWADYLVIPSRIESIPVVFSDAMKSATPVICTPVGDLPKLIDEYGVGILAGAVDAEGLAQGIRQALSASPQTYLSGMKKAAGKFDASTIAREILYALRLGKGR